MLVAKALPVRGWQSRQWQAWTISGAAVSRYRTAPQAQPPSRFIGPLPLSPQAVYYDSGGLVRNGRRRGSAQGGGDHGDGDRGTRIRVQEQPGVNRIAASFARLGSG